MRISTKFVSILLAFICLLFSSTSALAVQFKGEESLNFAKGQKIEETMFIAGESITFDSDIIGDLYCAGQSIVITGNVKGDIICAGQSIKITGLVDGNVRIIAQQAEITGTINRNLNFLGQILTLDNQSSVKGDVLFGVQSISLLGAAGRDLAGAGDTVTISGSLLRNATVNVSSLNITDNATIKGDLDYYTEQSSTSSISANSVIGQIRRHDYVTEDAPIATERVDTFSPVGLFFKALLGALSFFIIASALIFFDKSRTEKIINLVQERPAVNALIGLAAFATFPIAFMILMITFIGMPLALVLLLVYTVSLITASVYTSIVIGWNILRLLNRMHPSPFLSALVGTLALGIVASIPVVGWLAALVAFFIGLGALTRSYLPEKTK